jgi:hypothetical protein
MRRIVDPFVVLVLLCAYLPAAATAALFGGLQAFVVAGTPAVAYLALVACLRWARPDLRLPGRAEVRHCTTRELCRAWSRSQAMLREVTDPARRLRLVALRQAYLDTMERRDPIGFALWISLSPPGRVPPDVYIGRVGPDHGLPD